ncbi:DUF1361 domain-containing protein [Pleurocapsa sp. CCALA 161]|uniref:DUF1361 domain-containing protein n=1 Tax=Pleurocapsa sp. CCALA 161 TaxID=2107688 RepID=UPI000D07C734|nr:DUF1361 domain-containing protein [Pleurocapsa sp. CCALA 161]PSB12162.1 DUF1361 domain-containing protein [Pleurocapsa sp. CCALA 161]
MTTQLINWMQISGNLFNQSTSRIIWNLFLAFIPLVLSFYLFRLPAVRNLWWWALLLIFMAFLPNAPYILTDSIHIIELSQLGYPHWAIIFILIPQYILFICLGFEAYVISLVNLEQYLTNFIAPKYLTIVNAIAHGLCIVGVYLGRLERFNSWDFVTKPGTVLATTLQDLFDGWKLLSMAIAFIAIWLLSELIKLVNQKGGLS